MYGLSSAISSSAPTDIAVKLGRSSKWVLRLTDYEGNYLEAEPEAWVSDICKGAQFNTAGESHKLRAWVDAITLPANSTTTESVSSSEASAASQLTNVVSAGSLAITGNGTDSLKFTVDAWRCAFVMARAAQEGMARQGDTQSVAWASFYGTIKSAKWE